MIRWKGGSMKTPAVSRSASVVALLGLALVVTAALSWEAVVGARRARSTAEGVLRGYAAFAAAEFAQQLDARLCSLVSSGLAWIRHSTGAHPHSAAGAAAGCDCASPPALISTFVVDPTAVRMLQGPRLPDALVEVLRADLAGAPAHDHGRLRVTDDGSILVSAVEAGMTIGFLSGPSSLDGVVARVLREGQLFPGALVPPAANRDVLSVRVSDSTGRARLDEGPGFSPYAGEARLAPAGGDVRIAPLIDDLRVEIAIAPDQASRFVIGGLPSSRWPVAVGLLALAAGLVVAAALQLTREIRFARARADFVSAVSHELRTPLAQIRLFGETLQLGRVRSRDEEQRAVAVIVQEARRLGQLVDNVLTFSRASRGAAVVRREAVDPAAVVAEVVEGFRPQATSRGARIDLDVAAPVPKAAIDPDALRQILLNLLDNAVKYGPRGQTVRVALSVERQKVRLAVEDEGPGIAAADRHRIWEPFWRAPGSAEGGTGLGLAIVRDLVAGLGGSAAVEAGARGGARFVVAFDPAPAAPEPAGAPNESLPAV
jgi:signal transduction histidine kinase